MTEIEIIPMCGELTLEEATDMSKDRLENEIHINN
jgi:hypothetical protein